MRVFQRSAVRVRKSKERDERRGGLYKLDMSGTHLLLCPTA